MFTSATKRESRYFHDAVVQLLQRNVKKSVMHVQSCCFTHYTYCFFAVLVDVAVVISSLLLRCYVLRPIHTRGFAPGACPRLILHVSVHTRERFHLAQFAPGACSQIFNRLNIVEHFTGWKFCSRGWSVPMKSLVQTEELCSRTLPLQHAPGAQSLVCIGLYTELAMFCVFKNEWQRRWTKVIFGRNEGQTNLYCSGLF